MKIRVRVSPLASLLFIAILLAAFCSSSEAADSQTSFENNFSIMWPEDHFKTSEDGQTWYLSLDKETGCGFQTKQKYRFDWFSMKLQLVGDDSAGVVTAYYLSAFDSFAHILTDDISIVLVFLFWVGS